MSDISTHDHLRLYWNEDGVAKVMRRNKIHDRRDLAKRIDQPYSTICDNLTTAWSGSVRTFAVLAAMCQVFGVKLSALVIEPKDL